MRVLALVDFDDTLFQTLRKCPPEVPHGSLLPLGYDKAGAPLSYATPRQANFLAWLSETALFVPVTARSRDALERVRIPWTTAICAHGGLILEAPGRADPEWRAHIAREAAGYSPVLETLRSRMIQEAGDADLAIRIIEEDGIPLYLLVKDKEGDAETLSRAVSRLADEVPAGWTLHRNGNNAAFLPPFLGKHRAVEWLLPRLRRLYPDAAVIGIGDSLTDAPFMRLCDFAAMPTPSQLADAALGPLT